MIKFYIKEIEQTLIVERENAIHLLPIVSFIIL